MYYNHSISPRPCPPSPRNNYNNPRSKSKLRVFNPNSSIRNNSANSSQYSFNDSGSEESPSPSPQLHFTVAKMALSISPRNTQDIFNTAFYKRHKTPKRMDENNSNPYLPVQPLTDDKIDQIKAMLKMTYNENINSPDEETFEVSVMDDEVIDNLLSRIENHLQALQPSYFQSNSSIIPSTPISSTNSFTSSIKLSAKNSGLSSPKSPRLLSANISSGLQSFQAGTDPKQKKKLRISRSPSADIEKYMTIDKNGNDNLDRRIIELKGRLMKIADIIKARNANS